MASKFVLLKNVINLRNLSSFRRGFTAGRIIYNRPPSVTSSKATDPNVPGLSTKVVDFGKGPVGPGASKNSNYPNPEYFCYHKGSFHEAEIEMAKYRCPQPSSK